MKKILFGTTALLAAGAFASAAQASDPVKLQLGGYSENYMVGASQSGDFKDGPAANATNNFDFQSDSEVWFIGKTTLDNGMTIGVQVELEAGSNASSQTDTIDESYIYLEGKYGKVILGSEDDVVYLSHVGAPDASYIGGGVTDGSINNIMPKGTGVSALDTIEAFTGDANKISYFTPKFYGLQAGVSYVPSNDRQGDDGNATSETIGKIANTFDDAWAFTVNYSTDLSGVGVKATAGYITMDANSINAEKSTTVQNVRGGLALSYQGFTLGGSVSRLIAANGAASGLGTGVNNIAAKDGFAWDAGLQYAEGPYAVSFGYEHSKVAGDRTGSDTYADWRLGAKYAMGPGVDLFAFLAYVNAENGAAGAADTTENDGAIGGAVGLRLNF